MAVTITNISNFLDVVDLIPQLYDPEENKFNVLSQEEIRSIITRTDSRLKSELKPLYGSNLTTSVPYTTTPIARFGNSESGTILLQNAAGTSTLTVAATLTSTQVYKIKFTSGTAFTVTSDLTGANGTGSTAESFTTTDGKLTMPTGIYNGTFFNGDIHYLKVYNHETALVYLSALLAANTILNTIYTEEVPDASATAEKYLEQYTDQVRALQNGKAFLEKGLTPRDINPIQVDYEIDEYGVDSTNYPEKDWNPRTGY
tara:strand:- start:1174 stop:1947 length:774 start_codon:yes stop_codon:yes gene_type:complete